MKISDSLRKTLSYRFFALVGRLMLFVVGVLVGPSFLIGGVGGLLIGEFYAGVLYYYFEKSFK